MKPISHFMLPENTNRLYKEEAASSIGLTREVADKINELVDAYNQFSNDDLMWKQTLEGSVRKGILYMKDNLVNTMNDLMEQLKDSGFIDDRIDLHIIQLIEEAGRLTARLDSLLGTVTTGYTTMDAEVIDVRTGGDGVLYQNAGTSVRTQIQNVRTELSHFIGTLQKEFGMITYFERDGYLTIYNGAVAFRGETENHSKSTVKLPCKEGDVFTYSGRGRNAAFSWVFYKDNAIISTGQHEGTIDVVIPSSVNFVQFSSYGLLHEEVIFNVVYKPSETHARISELEKRNNIFITTEHEGYYTLEDGTLLYKGDAEYHSKTTNMIPCKENEMFLYNGVGRSSTLSWVFYNGSTVVSTGQYSGSTTVIIPSGVDYVQFSSFAALQDEVVLNVHYMNSEAKEESSNILHGKKYVACGDSFTIGDYADSLTNDYIFTDGLYAGEKKSYPYFIGRRNNMIVVNEALGGSTITNIDGRNPFSVDRYKNIPLDADYITIKIGINDSNQDAPLGTIDDTANTTFYGAWNVVMEYLLRNFPFAKIGIIVTNGAKLQYANATIQIAKKWGVPYLDMATGVNIPLMLRTNRTDVSQLAIDLRNRDFAVNWGVNHHPNEKAHEFESTIVEHWLRSL